MLGRASRLLLVEDLQQWLLLESAPELPPAVSVFHTLDSQPAYLTNHQLLPLASRSMYFLAGVLEAEL